MFTNCPYYRVILTRGTTARRRPVQGAAIPAIEYCRKTVNDWGNPAYRKKVRKFEERLTRSSTNPKHPRTQTLHRTLPLLIKGVTQGR